MKKIILPAIGIAFLTSSCLSYSVMKKKDYIEKSDEEIRSILLQYTPIGCKENDVVEVMRKTFRRKVKKYYVYNDVSVIEKSRVFSGKIDIGDYTVIGTLGTYGWAKHFFLSGNIVEALWLFNKDGFLKEIEVFHNSDGV